MLAVTKYRIVRLLLLIVVGVIAGCFAKLVNVGLASPEKAQFWFAMLFVALFAGMAVTLLLYYYRSRLHQTSSDKIAIEALAAAGKAVAEEQKKQQTAAKRPGKK